MEFGAIGERCAIRPDRCGHEGEFPSFSVKLIPYLACNLHRFPQYVFTSCHGKAFLGKSQERDLVASGNQYSRAGLEVSPMHLSNFSRVVEKHTPGPKAIAYVAAIALSLIMPPSMINGRASASADLLKVELMQLPTGTGLMLARLSGKSLL